jgi:TolA-binding protein
VTHPATPDAPMPRLLMRYAATVAALTVTAAAQGQTPEGFTRFAVGVAWKDYERGDFDAARKGFTRAVTMAANTPQASAAAYGFGVSLARVPDPDYAKALSTLSRAGEDGALPQRADALALMGYCRRQLGLRESKPQDARQQFQQARTAFATARDLWAARDPEASARARCDAAEMAVRLGLLNDARAECEPFLKDGPEAKTASRDRGLYLLGLAGYLDRDATRHREARRPLLLLSPFRQTVFGLHAECLVGLLLQDGGEEAEAAVHYEAVLDRADDVRRDAARQLAKPATLATDPAETARLQALVKSAPDAVAGAAFQLAGLRADAGRAGDALDRFKRFPADYPDSPLVPEAALRVAIGLRDAGKLDEAAALLAPLQSGTGPLKVEADFALASVRHAQADTPAAAKSATDAMRGAAARARSDVQDPLAGPRQQRMRLELADALHADGRFDEAAALYEQLWTEQTFKGQRDEILASFVTALSNAGKVDPSHYRADEFRRTFPNSPLAPAVALADAQNHLRRAAEWSKDRNRAREADQKFAEASSAFKSIIAASPDDPAANLARFSRGECEARLGHTADAAAAYAAIPPASRVGDLARTDLALADCLARLGQPAKAVKVLEEYVTRAGRSPDALDALRRLAECQERVGAFDAARDALKRITTDFPGDPRAGEVAVALAALPAAKGDRIEAMRALREYETVPGKKDSRAAPLAIARLGALLREDGRALIATEVLKPARERSREALKADKTRPGWSDLLKYQHALALSETGQSAEARKLFEEIATAGEDRPIGMAAAIASAGARFREAAAHLATGTKLLASAGKSNDKRNAARRELDRGRDINREAAYHLRDRAYRLRDRAPDAPARARMLSLAAWGLREAAADEVERYVASNAEVTRRRWAEEVLGDLADGRQPGPPPAVPPPAFVNTEAESLEVARRLFEDFPSAPESIHARLEVAQWLRDRGRSDLAKEVLSVAAESLPAGEMTDRLRLKLGDVLTDAGKPAEAAKPFEAVAAAGGPWADAARDRLGAARLAAGDTRGALKALAPFASDTAKGDAAERGLVRLAAARLADGQVKAAADAFGNYAKRFADAGQFTATAQFGAAAILQAQRKYDDAARAFGGLADAGGEFAALARFHLAQCRHAEKRFGDAAAVYLAVPFTPGCPDAVANAATLGAARAFAEAGQTATAGAILLKLALDAPPESVWVGAAEGRLVELP